MTDLDEQFVTLNEIDEYGFYIGFTQFPIEDIVDIEVDDRYLKRLNYIFNNNSKIDPKSRVTIWKRGSELLSDINLLIKKEELVTLFIKEDCYSTGILLKCDDSYIMMKNVGTEGDEDGVSYYPVDNLIGLRHSSLVEQKIKLLYENRDAFYL